MPQPMIVAHRGNTRSSAPVSPPENTIAAFETAILAQADMVELDIRRTQDGSLIIHHDPTLAGTPLNCLSIQEIQAYNPSIPTLESVLIHCKHRIRLDFELKEAGYESDILNLIKQHLTINEFVITSFQASVLHQVQLLQPEITIGLLLEASAQQRSRQTIEQEIRHLKPNFLGAHYTLLDSSWLEAMNYQQTPYWVWTVNKKQEIQRFSANSHVQAIITDDCYSIMNTYTQSL
jgi:glycerophosphoryl diester phosphodiesterase